MSRFRGQLLAALAALQPFAVTTDDAVYAALQASLERAAPDIVNRVWMHKYLHMLCPDVLDDFHNEDLQESHLVSLLQVSPAGSGRYLRAGRYVRIARELGVPTNLLSAELNHRWHKAHQGHWMVPAGSVSRRDGAVLLDAARPLPARTVFAICVGPQVVAIGRLLADHPGDAAARTPAQWLDHLCWRLPEPAPGGVTVKKFASAVNRVAIDRRILEAGRPEGGLSASNGFAQRGRGGQPPL